MQSSSHQTVLCILKNNQWRLGLDHLHYENVESIISGKLFCNISVSGYWTFLSCSPTLKSSADALESISQTKKTFLYTWCSQCWLILFALLKSIFLIHSILTAVPLPLHCSHSALPSPFLLHVHSSSASIYIYKSRLPMTITWTQHKLQ